LANGSFAHLSISMIFLLIFFKIRLPVCILQIPKNYADLMPIESTGKFICSIDSTITGDIHFDVDKKTNVDVEAYVSL
jgi:hypothetical protein